MHDGDLFSLLTPQSVRVLWYKRYAFHVFHLEWSVEVIHPLLTSGDALQEPADFSGGHEFSLFPVTQD